jgi:hypothetical protein
MVLAAYFPEWLTGERYVTFATWGLVAATLILALITLLLVLDSRANRREQRDRWAREDRELRAERDELRQRWEYEDSRRDAEAIPKAEWRLTETDDHYSFLLWCANLGSTSFMITELNVVPLGGSELQTFPIEKRIVASGQIEEIKFRADSMGDIFHDDVDISLKLRGPSCSIDTPAQPYRLIFVEGRRMLLKQGFGLLIRCVCPKCGSLLANMKTDDLDPEQVRQALAVVQEEFVASCPDHKSHSARLTTTGNLVKLSV